MSFYIELAKLLSEGLSNIGTVQRQSGGLIGSTVEETGGNILAKGIMGYTKTEISAIEELISDKFIKKSFYVGLAFSALLHSKDFFLEPILDGMEDKDIEIRKISIMALGLLKFKSGDSSTNKILSPLLFDKNWKIRAAAGLAYSFAFFSNPKYFQKFIDILADEPNPYVKVCSCWYISVAFAGTGEGKEEYLQLLNLKGDHNSFFRDMASIGLGLSNIGSPNDELLQLFHSIILDDSHFYVRESACFGLGINFFSSANQQFEDVICNAFKDKSSVVRGGAALSCGVANYGQKTLPRSLLKIKDKDGIWGVNIAKGLAGIDLKHDEDDPYKLWGKYTGDIFRTNTSISKENITSAVLQFQSPINMALKSLSLKDAAAVKLIYPGLFYYLFFDSFWWGLWMLSSVGMTLLSPEVAKE